MNKNTEKELDVNKELSATDAPVDEEAIIRRWKTDFVVAFVNYVHDKNFAEAMAEEMVGEYREDILCGEYLAENAAEDANEELE